MGMDRFFIRVGLTTMAIVTVLVCSISEAAHEAGARTEEKPVSYEEIAANTYQNFIKNWDDKKHPVLVALIRTPAQYAALFHPAAVMGNKRPFAPEPELYAKERILVVARVTTASEDTDKVFHVERVIQKGQELSVYYGFIEPKSNATYSVKSYLALRIPKRPCKKVVFFENGKEVGRLNTAQGQWSVPTIKP